MTTATIATTPATPAASNAGMPSHGRVATSSTVPETSIVTPFTAGLPHRLSSPSGTALYSA